MIQANPTSLIREGIAAAQTGDKAQAQSILRDATVQEPESELAWLWLAQVAESPQDALSSLRRVLEINPINERAREGIKAARMQAGAAEAKAGNKPAARLLLREATEEDPLNETAWLWLAGVAESPREMAESLKRVLEINPNNQRATEGMKSALLQLGIAEAKAGNKSAARHHLQELTNQEPNHELAWQWLACVAESSLDALAGWQRVLEINPNNDRANEEIQRLHANLAASARVLAEENYAPPWECPLCSHPDREEQTRCQACGALLTFADVDAFQANVSVDSVKVREAIDHYETLVRRQRADFHSFHALALAHLNLKEIDKSVTHLQAAVRLRPDDRNLQGQLAVLEQKLAALEAAAAEKTNAEKAKLPRLLVVDESPTVRKLVALTMEKNGYQVISAADGHEAAERILKSLPDLILLDSSLPGIDGFQVCKHIKGIRETAHIPVVMMSNKDSLLDRIRGRMAGSAACIAKPFKPETLVQVVHKYCGARP